MKNILKIFTILPMVGLLSACGTQVEVPPAKVGKIMTKDGYREGMVTTSRFRLDRCIWYCDRLILLDVSDRTAKEDMTIFIPEDKLNLNVGIQVTLSLAGRNVEPLFNSIPPDATENPVVSVIEWNSIYNTYARQVVLTETREYLSQFSIAEISSSLEKINADLRVKLQEKIQNATPFAVRNVGITNITYPKIITDAQENAAERRERVQQEEAQLEIATVTLERQLQEAQLNRKIEVEKAETEALAQRIQRESIDPRVLELRRLEIQREWVNKWDGRLPATIMTDDANVLMNIPTKE